MDFVIYALAFLVCFFGGYMIGYMLWGPKEKPAPIKELSKAQLEGEEKALLFSMSLIANANEYKAFGYTLTLEKLNQRLYSVQKSLIGLGAKD
jgi:hypothetical protein